MATNRKLIHYLPLFMQEYVEMQNIMETEQVEVDRLWLEVENALADQFVMEATETGIVRWERMLGISPKDTDNLDERRFRILAYMNQELPYTLRKLEQTLTNLCGVDGYSINMNSAEYTIEVKIGVANISNYNEVERILNKMIPANMIPSISIKYNAHTLLTQFTHAQLSTYTHEELRNEVFN